MNKKARVIGTIFLIVFFVVLIAGLIYAFDRTLKWNIKKESVESVEIKQSIVDDLNDLYATSAEEFVFCLSGTIEDNKAIITEYSVPTEYVTEENDIKSVNCEPFTILTPFKKQKHLGTIHNHPDGKCYLGEADVFTFGRYKDATIGIICNIDSIHFFTSKNLIESVELKIIN